MFIKTQFIKNHWIRRTFRLQGIIRPTTFFFNNRGNKKNNLIKYNFVIEVIKLLCAHFHNAN